MLQNMRGNAPEKERKIHMTEYNTNASAQGHELGWDDEIQQESSFVLLPEDDYRYTVE